MYFFFRKKIWSKWTKWIAQQSIARQDHSWTVVPLFFLCLCSLYNLFRFSYKQSCGENYQCLEKCLLKKSGWASEHWMSVHFICSSHGEGLMVNSLMINSYAYLCDKQIPFFSRRFWLADFEISADKPARFESKARIMCRL